MSLYPETTISPMSAPPSGSHIRNLEPMQPMPLKPVIKQEPVAYIKREDNNNAPHVLQLHPSQLHPHHHLLSEGYSLHNPGISPISPGASMGSPGSPPTSMSMSLGEKSHVAMAILNNSRGGPQGGHVMLPGQGSNLGSPGGGKMPSSGASSSRKKSTSTGNPEEDELASIPSLQMRIKILQQRVR